MKKRGKSLFSELISIDLKDSKKELEESVEDELEGDLGENIDGNIDEESASTIFQGSPLYPHIYIGESARPLAGMFPESEYVDDNIHNTYKGLLSFFG